MSSGNLTNPNELVTKQMLNDYHETILPYLGGMPNIVANKFDKGNLYSTDEKMIGQWIDGKPIYQRTFNFIAPSENVVPTNVVTLDGTCTNVRIIDGAIFSTSPETYIPINMAAGGNYYVWTYISGNTNNKYITVEVKNMYNGCNGYITIQYTKTTDSAIAIGSDTDYSTDEKIIGTWIDGKPVYQKTISRVITNDKNATKNYMDITDLHLEKLIRVKGMYNESSGTNCGCFPFSEGSTQSFIHVITNDNNTKLLWIVGTGSWLTNIQTYTTIQYTKTTD